MPILRTGKLRKALPLYAIARSFKINEEVKMIVNINEINGYEKIGNVIKKTKDLYNWFIIERFPRNSLRLEFFMK